MIQPIQIEYKGPMLWLDQFDASLDETVLYAFGAVGAICVVLAVILLVLGCVLKGSNTPGSSMNFYVALGSLLLVGCVIIQGQKPDDVAEVSEYLCQIYPPVLCYGLILVTGALLVRCIHIFNFHRKHAQKVHREEWKANLMMFLLLVIEAAPILVWLILYDLGVEEGDATSCTSSEWGWFKLGMSAYHGLIILLGAIMIWPAMFYSRKSPTEIDSSILSVCIYLTLLAAAGGTLIFMFLELEPAGTLTTATITYAISGGLILAVVAITLAMLIAAKLCVARKMSGGEGEYYSKMGGSSSPNSGNSRINDDLYVNDSPRHSHIAETFSY